MMIKKYIRNVIAVLALVGCMWFMNLIFFYIIFPKWNTILLEMFRIAYIPIVLNYLCGMLSVGLIAMSCGIAFRIKPLTALLAALIFMLWDHITLAAYPIQSKPFMKMIFLYVFFAVAAAGLAYVMVKLGSNIRNKVSTKEKNDS